MTEQMQQALGELLDSPVRISSARMIPGGASKEAWAVDAVGPDGTLELLVRRAGGGVIYKHTLSLRDESAVLQAAYQAGIKVPRVYGYLADLAGREAFVMQRVQGESIGRRIVQKPELSRARAQMPAQMAQTLAKIHAIPKSLLPALPAHGDAKKAASLRAVQWAQQELDSFGEPHPAIELGLAWMREHAARAAGADQDTLVHGDFRIGNLMVDENGLVAVLDWEFAHFGAAAEDLAWPQVRAWRFGMDHLRLGGLSAAQEFLAQYNELSGRDIGAQQLFFWEVAGNVRWAIGSLTQARRHWSGQERSVELAVLGRLTCEIELEILSLIEKGGYAG
ncbi:MAG: phosphotransferase family protein [Burkholderiales bacterium]